MHTVMRSRPTHGLLTLNGLFICFFKSDGGHVHLKLRCSSSSAEGIPVSVEADETLWSHNFLRHAKAIFQRGE
jgi:hypothetical protein